MPSIFSHYIEGIVPVIAELLCYQQLLDDQSDARPVNSTLLLIIVGLHGPYKNSRASRDERRRVVFH